MGNRESGMVLKSFGGGPTPGRRPPASPSPLPPSLQGRGDWNRPVHRPLPPSPPRGGEGRGEAGVPYFPLPPAPLPPGKGGFGLPGPPPSVPLSPLGGRGPG
ncbi:hypothetical protein JCM30394_26980 [Deferrisoma palaeochoriense]